MSSWSGFGWSLSFLVGENLLEKKWVTILGSSPNRESPLALTLQVAGLPMYADTESLVNATD